MEVKITRKTGFMGGTTSVSLLVDKQEEVKLHNNQEYIIESAKDHVTVRVKQWFFGSKELSVNKNEQYDIKVNPICLLLLYAGLIFVLSAGFMNQPDLKVILAGIGLGSLFATAFMSLKSWFILQKHHLN